MELTTKNHYTITQMLDEPGEPGYNIEVLKDQVYNMNRFIGKSYGYYGDDDDDTFEFDGELNATYEWHMNQKIKEKDRTNEYTMIRAGVKRFVKYFMEHIEKIVVESIHKSKHVEYHNLIKSLKVQHNEFMETAIKENIEKTKLEAEVSSRAEEERKNKCADEERKNKAKQLYDELKNDDKVYKYFSELCA